jgi:predicted PurR-regulated permease PerM
MVEGQRNNLRGPHKRSPSIQDHRAEDGASRPPEVGKYYAAVAVINVGWGLATAVLLYLLGMPNPLLWGVLVALLHFIPHVGSATAWILLTLVAFVYFDTVAPVLALAGGYLVLATIEGRVVQPLLVGQRLELNPIIAFLRRSPLRFA